MNVRSFLFTSACLVLGLWTAPASAARDAAFLSPSSAMGAGQEEIRIEPKSDIDLGETGVNVARRTTFFFVNVSPAPIEIVDVTANGDSNVRASVADDDCTKQGRIAVNSRCSVAVETMPSGAGPWTAEVVLTHKGAGRLARARLTGRTSGAAGDRRETGLSLSTKDVKPVDFGEVEVGTDKAVRTALMVNDSSEPITILSVELIAAENGMEKLEQGCAADMDLKPAESCPITMIWKPTAKGIISTDLIIRHSGRQGFAVIPVRGSAKESVGGGAGALASASGKGGASGSSAASSSKIPLSPTADELEKMIAGNMTPVPADALKAPGGHAISGKAGGDSASLGLHLIGTVGNRGVFYLDSDGSSIVVSLGEDMVVDGQTIKLTNIMAKQAELYVDGKKKTLNLETVAALTSRAGSAKAAPVAATTTSGSKAKPASIPLPMGY